jgi:hypothetical protein
MKKREMKMNRALAMLFFAFWLPPVGYGASQEREELSSLHPPRRPPRPMLTVRPLLKATTARSVPIQPLLKFTQHAFSRGEQPIEQHRLGGHAS